MNVPRIIIATVDDSAETSIRRAFENTRCERARSLDEISSLRGPDPYEFFFVDLDILESGSQRAETLDTLRKSFPTARIIVMTPQDRVADAIAVVRSGAATYLTLPLTEAEIRYVCESLDHEARFEGELDHLRGQFWRREFLELLRTNSPAMRGVFNAIRQVAPTKATVLLLGETGTGKNLLAKLIHVHSNRPNGPFIQVHCGAIPEDLLESELFGHERGAFTGAVRRSLGRFEIANGGTIFLDEIGTMPLSMQGKLLCVLQDRTFERVGGEHQIHVDVRVVAATNTNLEAASNEGRFRKDLFFRLNVFPITIPPLRERIEDLEIILDSILTRLEKEYGKRIFRIAPEVIAAFKTYPWPGNIRELESLVERAYILETGSELSTAGFPPDLFFFGQGQEGGPSSQDAIVSLAEVRHLAVEQAERSYVELLMRTFHGRTAEAAVAAGITPRQLRNILHRHGVDPKTYKNRAEAPLRKGK